MLNILQNRIVLKDELFWSTDQTFPELSSQDLRAFTNTNLIILKGDVNYRKLLDDRKWMMGVATLLGRDHDLMCLIASSISTYMMPISLA